jgi:fumarate reductase flavoprotein subunit
VRSLETDILILGAGGAGLFAALHAHKAAPDASITVAVKGLLGKCGCTRMVQGGYNVALAKEDSVERHFMDTIEGGKWLPDQDLAWMLVTLAVEANPRAGERARLLLRPQPRRHRCTRRRSRGKPSTAPCTRATSPGIEIINRLAEQVWARRIDRLEEHRAVELIKSRDGSAMAGVLFVDMRSGEYVFVRAKAVLLATGGGPTMYKYHTPSGDKSCDGLAMALRAGLALRDMEMVQFHPTGLLAGTHTRMTGTVLEEGLRGSGGHLLNGAKQRFMPQYDRLAERATRDVVSRAMYSEIQKKNTTPHGGLYISMAHLGPDRVAREFKGMVERCADCGFDLAGGLVEVVPTAHYMMGGVEFRGRLQHGAARAVRRRRGFRGRARGEPASAETASPIRRCSARWPATCWPAGSQAAASGLPIPMRSTPPWPLAKRRSAGALQGAWSRFVNGSTTSCGKRVGIIRDGPGLEEALRALASLETELDASGLGDHNRAFNLTWHDWMNLKSLVSVSRAIAAAAIARKDSRGAHFRSEHPESGPLETSQFTSISLSQNSLKVVMKPVTFTRVRPGQTLLKHVA